MNSIPLTLPKFTAFETDAIADLLAHPEKFITEEYSKKCRAFLTNIYNTEVLVTHSCTAALEMSALLLNLKPGDEVIIPSYTFVTTANAFALFGIKPVFADIDKETLNLDVNQLEQLITPNTKAIIPMHYAAIACEMQQLNEIATTHSLLIVEDAAQCIGANYNNQPLGTFGQLGALSFHHTKNITAGFGGALIINDPTLVERAKIIWQKGTNREAFIAGFVDKYTWQDIGSSYMMSELNAALLYGQLQRLEKINNDRLAIWSQYHESFRDLEQKFAFKRPLAPTSCQHNGHCYYLIAPTKIAATKLRQQLIMNGINASNHYLPLHLSPAGKRFSTTTISLPVCEDIHQRIIRLPIWETIEQHVPAIIETVYQHVNPPH